MTVVNSGDSSKYFRDRDGHLDFPGCGSGHRIHSGYRSERCEEVIRPSSGLGSQIGGYGKEPNRTFQPSSGFRKRAKVIMSLIFKTTKEWWLVGLCLILLSAQFFPQAIELVYPIIDWKGGNRLNMQTDRKDYNCGEQVLARFMLQKQREAVGTIQWKLVASRPGGNAYVFPARTVSSPVGITDHYAPVERLPEVCQPGEYHFEGTIVYPLGLDKVIYTLRTTCFDVKEKRK